MQRPWLFEPRLGYVASLMYLALIGSVVAFLFYYGLARRRGYTAATYVSALTPVVARPYRAFSRANPGARSQ
jgi:drug/metabolite transporter (DMT)-like permease